MKQMKNCIENMATFKLDVLAFAAARPESFKIEEYPLVTWIKMK